MLLLFDIGNTNTHVGLANDARVLKQASVPTRGWFDGSRPSGQTASQMRWPSAIILAFRPSWWISARQ